MMQNRLRIIALLPLCAALLSSCGGAGIIPGGEKAPVVNEEEARAHLRTALSFADSRPPQWARANAEFKSAVDADYRLLPAHIGYQDSFFKLFNPQVPVQVERQGEMLKMYEKYAKKYPSEAAFQYLLGRMLDNMNRRKDAVEYFKAAIKLDDRFYPAHADLARFYDEVDKSPALAKYHRDKSEKYRAIHELRGALAANPSDIPLHRQYQDVMLAAEDSKDVRAGAALEEYKTRLQDAAGDPKREAQYLYLYGRLLGQTGSLEEARKNFEQAAALNDKLPWPYDGLGTYFIRKAQEPGTSEADRDDFINQALQMLEKAARKDPAQPVINLKLSGLCAEVASLRLKQADALRAKTESPSPEEERKMKELLWDAYRRSNQGKSILLGMTETDLREPELYQQMAMLMYGDECYFLTRQTSLAGLAILRENPPVDPAARQRMEVKLSGLAADSETFIRRMEEDREKSPHCPQLFFEEEFRARMQSGSDDFRARIVTHLAAFYEQIMQDRQLLDPRILPDYEKMQKAALVQIGMALKDKAEKVRKEAVSVLGLLRVQPFCENIGRILQDPGESAALRREAATALGRMRAAEGIDFLITGLKDEDRFVREESADSLREMGVQTFGYNFDEEDAARAEKIRKIEDWWKENRAAHKIPAGE